MRVIGGESNICNQRSATGEEIIHVFIDWKIIWTHTTSFRSSSLLAVGNRNLGMAPIRPTTQKSLDVVPSNNTWLLNLQHQEQPRIHARITFFPCFAT